MGESEDGGESFVRAIGGTAGERLGGASSGSRKATTTLARGNIAHGPSLSPITLAHIRYTCAWWLETSACPHYPECIYPAQATLEVGRWRRSARATARLVPAKGVQARRPIDSVLSPGIATS